MLQAGARALADVLLPGAGAGALARGRARHALAAARAAAVAPGARSYATGAPSSHEELAEFRSNVSVRARGHQRARRRDLAPKAAPPQRPAHASACTRMRTRLRVRVAAPGRMQARAPNPPHAPHAGLGGGDDQPGYGRGGRPQQHLPNWS